MHIHKTYDMLEKPSSDKLRPEAKKAYRQDSLENKSPSNLLCAGVDVERRKLFLNGVLLITIVKQIMNAYPCLHDFSMVVLLVILNWSFVSKKVELLFLFIGATVYAIINMALLWITWL